MSLELNECSCRRSEIVYAPLVSSRFLQPHLRIGSSDVDSLSLQDDLVRLPSRTFDVICTHWVKKMASCERGITENRRWDEWKMA